MLHAEESPIRSEAEPLCIAVARAEDSKCAGVWIDAQNAAVTRARSGASPLAVGGVAGGGIEHAVGAEAQPSTVVDARRSNAVDQHGLGAVRFKAHDTVVVARRIHEEDAAL